MRSAISGITAERDEYVVVPPRPSEVEAPGQELSHSELKPEQQGQFQASRRSVMGAMLSHRGRTRPSAESEEPSHSTPSEINNRPPQYQVGQAFQPDIRLESLTYDEFDILAGG